MAEEYKILLGVELKEDNIKAEINNIKTDPIKVRLDTDAIKSDINKIKSQIESLNGIKINLGSGGASKTGISQAVNKDLASIKITANNAESVINGLKSTLSSMKFSNSSIGVITKDLEKMSLAVSNVKAKINGNKLNVTVKGIDNLDRAVTLVRQFDVSTGKIVEGGTTISQSFDNGTAAARRFNQQAEKFKKIELNIKTGKFNNDISEIESKFSKLTVKSESLRNAINDVKVARDAMVKASGKGDMESVISANERYEKALKSVNNQLKINAREQKDAAAKQKLADDRTLFQNKIDAWLKDNSAAAKKFGGTLTELRAKASSCDAVTLNHLKNQFKDVDKQAEALGLKTQTFGDRVRKQFERYSSYLSVASAMIYAVQGLRDMFEQVVAIDSAMTELKKVTDETNSTYDNFLTNASQKAQQIGTTIDNYISSTADFARLGYDFSEAANLSEVANVYTVVGDEIESIDDATNSIISTMKAFKIEANDSISIVDKFNEVSNNFAISSGGIGEALQRSASSLAAAGNDIDESIALITAANTVVQDPATVGTALKTVSMRVRGKIVPIYNENYSLCYAI